MSRRARAKRSDGDRPGAEWMRRAVELARDTHPHPNPRVGAVVLSAKGRYVAEAAHQGPGAAHAEAAAIHAAGAKARGGTLFVTLEPCTHHGRTPPCVEAIIDAGVARVVYGVLDPDVRVSGSGVKALLAAGVIVDQAAPGTAAAELDRGYLHHRRTGRPRVTLKLAATLDGQTAAVDGSSQWITSEAARADAHALRAASDAVMVGAGTLRIDDPSLDVRIDGYAGPQPRPVIVGGRLPLPDEARVYRRAPLIYAPQRPPALPESADLEVMWHPAGVDLEAMIKDLGSKGVLDLLVEGGATLARSMLDEGLVDHIVLYLAGSLAGGVGRPMFDGIFRAVEQSHRVSILSAVPIGPDLRIDIGPEAVTG